MQHNSEKKIENMIFIYLYIYIIMNILLNYSKFVKFDLDCLDSLLINM